MFYYIYLLVLSNKDIYTGYSENLKLRIKDHEFGKVSSTKHLRPIKLIHYEAYLKKEDAKRREKFLKTSDGKLFLKRQISVLLQEIRE